MKPEEPQEGPHSILGDGMTLREYLNNIFVENERTKLRDQFATAILSGLVSRDITWTASDDGITMTVMRAYKIADEMLALRSSYAGTV